MDDNQKKKAGPQARTIVSIAVLALLASLGACGGDAKSPNPDADASGDTTDNGDADMRDRLFELPEGWTAIEPEDAEGYAAVVNEVEGTRYQNPSVIERLDQKYEKCEIAIDDAGLIRSRCVDDIDWPAANPCPRGRWTLFAHYPLEIPESDWGYCLQDEYRFLTRNCVTVQLTPHCAADRFA